ncbi:hypothetical protein OSB04_011552 [Centaurea solstitialis]|uniref:Uncharacterized protein n=1 Tax=Centaurea solstitialis TaxID=347529 RepID=A0AA38TH74_9ASTR|nr:hypothetical protein OSB04_011552 [Centaurea solstitialis]
MKPDETSSAYLTKAQEYVDALANIGEAIKENELMKEKKSGDATFTTVTNNRNLEVFGAISSTPKPDQLQAIQQLLSQLGLQVQPVIALPAQAFYTNRSGNHRGRGRDSRRGRGNYNNRSQGGGNY